MLGKKTTTRSGSALFLPFRGLWQAQREFNVWNWYRKHAKTPSQLMIRDELERGYTTDLWELKKDPTAKYFKTSDELIYMVDSFKFPIQFPLRTLARGVKVDLKKEWEEKAPTLILISAKRLGAAEMLDSWRVPFEKEFPHLNVFEVDLVQQVGYWLLGPWLRRIARKQASPERWSKILYYNGIRKTKMWRFELEMKNRFVGYAYLVDKEGFIRWRASGIAQPEEITHMITATNKLIKQIARKKK